MKKETVETITEILSNRIKKERERDPMGMSNTLTVACAIGRAIKEGEPGFDLDNFYDKIGNERFGASK